MKSNKKFIILSIALALCILLSGCNKTEDAETVTETDIIETTPETEEPAPSEYTIVSGKEAIFSIVRPQELTASDSPVAAAIEIRKFINDRTGVSPKLGDDWKAADAEYDSKAFEILVGATAYPETAEVMNSLTYGEYSIKAVGNKIVVFSFTDAGYNKALSEMITLLRNALTEDADGTKTLALATDKLNKTDRAACIEKITNDELIAEGTPIIPFSSLKGEGKQELWRAIADCADIKL